MQIKLKKRSDIALISVTEDINIDTADDLAGFCIKLFKEGTVRVIINLKEVGHIDSKGLASLVQISKAVKQSNGALVLCEIPDSISPVFEITKLNQLLMFFKKNLLI